MNIEIGAFEAKTKLAELLRDVQNGKRFTITHRGKAVAELGPPTASGKPDSTAAIGAFQAFRRANPIQHRVNIKPLTEEGRE